MPTLASPMPSSAMLAGSGTDVPPPGGVVGLSGGGVVLAGGAARVKAEATEKVPTEPLRFRLAITLAGEGSKADRPSAGVKPPKLALVAAMRKLLHAAYSVTKNRRPFTIKPVEA